MSITGELEQMHRIPSYAHKHTDTHKHSSKHKNKCNNDCESKKSLNNIEQL